MPTGVIQPSFTSGELSPSVFGRIDLNRYQTGLKTCKNFIVRQYGGVTNRPGTTLVNEVKDSSGAVRLIPFAFSTVQTYILEFGDQYMRVHKDGGTVYDGASPVEIATPWEAADLQRLSYTQSADVVTICHPDYPPSQITRTSHTAWTVAEFNNVNGPFLEINVDESKTMYVSSAEGTIVLTSSFDVFSSDNIGDYVYLESMPESSIPVWEVAKAISNGDVITAGAAYYMAVSPNNGTYTRITGTLRPTHIEGNAWDGTGLVEASVYRPPGTTNNKDAIVGVEWQYLHSGYGTCKITAVTDARNATATVVKRLPDALVTSTSGTTKTVSGVSANVNGQLRVTTSIAHGITNGAKVTVIINWQWYGVTGKDEYGADVYGYVAKTSTYSRYCYVVDTTHVDVYASWPPAGYSSFTSGTIQAVSMSAQPTHKWAFSAWSVSEGYPSATGYNDQRQVFGGTYGQPQTVWFSAKGGYGDFGTSIPVLDDEAMTFTLASREVNEIRHFLPLSELILLTSGGEWLVRGDNGAVILPSTINVKAQGYGGSSYLPPLVVGSTALYVQDKGTQVRALGYSFEQDAFVGNDLTVLSSHLFQGHTLTSWAYQKTPFSTAWVVRDDGTLLGLTYLREQEVIGWHVHETDGTFESVASVSENNEDAVYFVVNRTINGTTKRFIERLDNRFYSDVKDARFLDCALHYDGTNTTSVTMTLSGGILYDHTEDLTLTASASVFSAGDVGDVIMYEDGDVVYRLTISGYTSATVVTVVANRFIPDEFRSARTDWIAGRNQFSGLSHLEGKTVGILADGNVLPQQVVASGEVALDRPYGKVHVGLPYAADFETLPLSVTGQNLRDKYKLVNKVSLLCESSRGIFAGTDSDNLTEYKQRSTEFYDQPIAPATDMFEILVTAKWDKNGIVFVRQSDPLPLTVLAVIPEVSIGGS